MSPLTRTRPPHVLLVEDDDGDALLVQEGFAEVGTDVALHRVRTGDDALAALAAARRGTGPRPDLILLDLNLPGTPGVDVLRAIKGDPRLREIPVVVLTTSSDERHVKAVYDQGGNAYVTKPVDLDAFLGAIKEVNDFWVKTARLPG